MTIPTPEEVETVISHEEGTTEASILLLQYATILRNPAVAMLLKLQEGGQGTPLTDAFRPIQSSSVEWVNFYITMFHHARNLELCTRAIEAATIERCARTCESEYPEYKGSGIIEHLPCFTEPSDCAKAIRALPSMVSLTKEK